MNFEEEKQLAIKLFNDCWELIDKPNRTEAENIEMLNLAISSRLHWGNVGGTLEKAIGEWQCSRVNALLGKGEDALLHAQQSRELAGQLSDPHFMRASSLEAMAYANFVLGQLEKAIELREEAISNLVGLDAEDASHIRKQIEELPF